MERLILFALAYPLGNTMWNRESQQFAMQKWRVLPPPISIFGDEVRLVHALGTKAMREHDWLHDAAKNRAIFAV